MSKKFSELIGCMVMFINRMKSILLIFVITLFMPVFAVGIWDLFLTTDKNLEEQLKFLDNLSECTPYKYHAEPSGIYQIYGMNNNACYIKWTLADCNFPEGVYQEFAKIQRHRAIERSERYKNGLMMELKDEEYRKLYDWGNAYCRSNFYNF